MGIQLYKYNMAEVVKVTFKKDNGPSNANDEVFILAKEDEINKWQNDRTIPLVNVVESFEIWHNTGSNEKVSSDKLQEIFDTDDIDSAIQMILTQGKLHGKPFGEKQGFIKNKQADKQ